MYRLDNLIGTEHDADSVNRSLRDFAQHQNASAVGAVHVTCADETEREAVESFQHWFAEPLLPNLKFSAKSPLRLATLGGRYEWGAVRLAEQHFATPETAEGFELLIVKLNAHVAVLESGGEVTFGKMDRYSNRSACCGALDAMLAGRHLPAIDDLRETFASEGKPRAEMLNDPDQVDPRYRSLYAAVVSARLQARRAIVDIQDFRPDVPTIYVVLPTVTVNRPQRDTEFVVGMYWADHRDGPSEVHYRGLGDDPSRYQIGSRHGLLRISDDQLEHRREARGHRNEVFRQWQKRRQQETLDLARLKDVANEHADEIGRDPQLANEALKTLLWLLADLSPVPASIMLFTKGIAGIHHLYCVHRLARGAQDVHGAKLIIGEVAKSADRMPADAARETVEIIVGHYGV